MKEEILSLAQQFIRIPSDPGNHKALEEILALASSMVSEYTVETFERNGVKSVLVYNAATRPEKFKLILNGHLDIIPGKAHQYIPRVEGDRLYGVGAMDMKANAACLILAFKEMAQKVDYPVALQLVTDEETGGFDGTKYQVEQGVRADFVIAGEPTNFNIVHKSKGVLWAKISCTGISAHGAYPWKGDNAIWTMGKFLTALEKKYPIPSEEVWETTVNLSKIETQNTTFNKIPDDCAVSLDVRYVPEEGEHIVEDIQALLPEGFTLEIIAKEPGQFVQSDNPYVQTLHTLAQKNTQRTLTLYGAQGSSDARHYSPVGGDGVEFGPVGGSIGADDEWVDIPSLEQYYQILTEFMSQFNNSTKK